MGPGEEELTSLAGHEVGGFRSLPSITAAFEQAALTWSPESSNHDAQAHLHEIDVPGTKSCLDLQGHNALFEGARRSCAPAIHQRFPCIAHAPTPGCLLTLLAPVAGPDSLGA